MAASHVYKDALTVMRPRMWGAGLFIVTLLIAAIVWSAFFRVPVSVNGQGILLAPGGMIDVVADAGGQVRALDVAPGDAVEPDTVVAHINQPELDLKLSVARSELLDAEKFRTDLIQFQQRDAKNRQTRRSARETSLTNRVSAVKERRDALADQRAGLYRLVENGTVVRERLMSIDQDLLIMNSQIAEAEDERVAMASEAAIKETEDERARLEADRRVAEARRSVATIEQQLARMGAVRSPFAGRVVETKVNVGQVVQPGTAVVALERKPERTASKLPFVVAYVSASDGKKIRKGMAVEVSPATTRREEHGFVIGHVAQVSEVPASSAGMMRRLQNDRLVQTFLHDLGAPFEVTIVLDSDPRNDDKPLWSSRLGTSPPIDSGTLAQVRVTVRSTSLLAMAIPALQYVDADATGPEGE